jgi:predicted dehydrogenase
MTLRWGVAGPGGIAERFADAVRQVDGSEIVAVASRSAERAQSFAARHGIARAHGAYELLADDPDVDVVYVATPHVAHAALAVAYLEADKHVLCEKPLALDAHEAAAMVATARANDRFLMEAMWTRFLPAYELLTELLEVGRIGRPLVVEADFGFRMPNVPGHRLFDRRLGGGALLDLGIYPLQLASLVLGAPDSIVAAGHVGQTAVDEQVAAILHHLGGAIAVVKAAIRAPLSCTARIAGRDGLIELPAFMHCPQHLVVDGAVVPAPFDGEGLRFQVEEVERCLERGERESRVMPLDETVELARTMDEVRRQVGVVYDVD